MKSRVLLVILAAALVISAAACGKNKDGAVELAPVSAADVSASVPSQTETAVAEPEVTTTTESATTSTTTTMTTTTTTTAPTTEATEPESLELRAMRALCNEWHFVSGQTEAEELDTGYMDAVLSINTEKEATYTTIIKRDYGPEIFIDRDMPVIISDAVLYDGCENEEWSAQLISNEKDIEYFVTVLPDGTLKFMQFTYYDGEETPFMFMADFVSNTYED